MITLWYVFPYMARYIEISQLYPENIPQNLLGKWHFDRAIPNHARMVTEQGIPIDVLSELAAHTGKTCDRAAFDKLVVAHKGKSKPAPA